MCFSEFGFEEEEGKEGSGRRKVRGKGKEKGKGGLDEF